MEIEIETSDSQLLPDLLETTSSSIQPGYQKSFPDGGSITLQKDIKRRSLTVPPETITLILSVGGSITANVISTWLYEKLKGRAIRLHIDRKEIQIDNGEIKKIIEESIDKL